MSDKRISYKRPNRTGSAVPQGPLLGRGRGQNRYRPEVNEVYQEGYLLQSILGLEEMTP